MVTGSYFGVNLRPEQYMANIAALSIAGPLILSVSPY